jgi:hypothetical protein
MTVLLPLPVTPRLRRPAFVPISAFDPSTAWESMAPKIRIFDRHWHLPKSKPIRIGIGILLIVGGIVGFLPVLGFWMIPLGLLVLSIDLPIVRRWRRQLTVWWHRRKGEEDETSDTEDAAAPASKKDASCGPDRRP